MENNQKWSPAKPKKIVARLLVDVETQIIPNFKAGDELYPTKTDIEVKAREIPEKN